MSVSDVSQIIGLILLVVIGVGMAVNIRKDRHRWPDPAERKPSPAEIAHDEAIKELASAIRTLAASLERLP